MNNAENKPASECLVISFVIAYAERAVKDEKTGAI